MKPFELLNEIKQERQNQQKKLEEMRSRRDTAIDELNALEKQYQDLVTKGEPAAVLDKLLDDIDRARTLADRRASEFEMFSKVKPGSNFTGEYIRNEFRKYTDEFRETEVEPVLKEMEVLAEQYLELQDKLTDKFNFHSQQRRAAETYMNDYVKKYGGTMYGATNLVANSPFILQKEQIKRF